MTTRPEDTSCDPAHLAELLLDCCPDFRPAVLAGDTLRKFAKLWSHHNHRSHLQLLMLCHGSWLLLSVWGLSSVWGLLRVWWWLFCHIHLRISLHVALLFPSFSSREMADLFGQETKAKSSVIQYIHSVQGEGVEPLGLPSFSLYRCPLQVQATKCINCRLLPFTSQY